MCVRYLLPLLAFPAFAVGAPAVCFAASPSVAPVAVPTGIDEQAEVEKGRNAYRAQKYDEADARFIQMLDPEHGTLHDKVLIRQARMYWGATRLAEHHDDDAAEIFETILTEDSDYTPDSLAFPTEVVNAFIDTRTKLRAKLDAIAREQFRRAAERRAREEAGRQQEAARLKLLERLAGEAEVTEKHSRWVALLPFGAGQFQNRQRTLGWVLAITEGALVAGGLATVPAYYVNLSNANSVYTPQTKPQAQEYLDRANAARDVNLALYGALALTAIVGAIQAEVAYGPDPVGIRPRAVPELTPPALPAPVSFSFSASPVTGPEGRGVSGATVGIVGRF